MLNLVHYPSRVQELYHHQGGGGDDLENPLEHIQHPLGGSGESDGHLSLLEPVDVDV